MSKKRVPSYYYVVIIRNKAENRPFDAFSFERQQNILILKNRRLRGKITLFSLLPDVGILVFFVFWGVGVFVVGCVRQLFNAQYFKQRQDNAGNVDGVRYSARVIV